MAKAPAPYHCASCGALTPKWVGRCAACGEWNSLRAADEPAAAGPVPITEVVLPDRPHRATGVAEVDRVLGGGLVDGSVTLLGGEPGIGKSTLLLQVAASVARSGRRCLYVSAEESAAQVRARAERLDALHEQLWLVHETDLEVIVGHVERARPALVVVDSVQTVHESGGGAAGSVPQVRAAAARFVEVAKRSGTTVVLVGHVTKDGALAGPRQLEHVVDTVLSFEGDRHHALRLLRALKHRFGAVDELGVFEMRGGGLVTVPDPSGMFLADCRWGLPGATVTCVLDGRRPLLVEVQALVAPPGATGRRSAVGLDAGRLAMLLAVLGAGGLGAVAGREVHAAVVGGLRVTEPAADLALVLAVVSAATGVVVPSDLVVLGEVGLAGELRQVSQLERRLAEAARMGFTRALVPMLSPEVAGPIVTERVATISEAIHVAGAPTSVA